MTDRSLERMCSRWRAAAPAILHEFNGLGPDLLFIVDTVRSLEEQQEAWAKGRTAPPIGPDHIVTKCDGIIRLSAHQEQMQHGELAGHAIDFGVMRGGVYVRDDRRPYVPLMELLERRGFISGWDFDHDGVRNTAGFIDAPHGECLG